MTNTVSETVSDETLDCIITIESGGRPAVKASTSSATGLFQFLNATWMGVVKQHRPDLLEGRTKGQVLELRKDPEIAIELGARFTEDNQRAIGMNCTGGDLYLAHFLGVADAKDLFRADPETPVSKLVSADAIKANRSILEGKSAGQVRAWAAKKMHAAAGRNWIARYCQPAEIEVIAEIPAPVIPQAEPPVVELVAAPEVVEPEPVTPWIGRVRAWFRKQVA